MHPPAIDAILVPKGAEYQAVCRGLETASSAPRVVPIPMGMAAVKAIQWQQTFQPGAKVLVMGLCGSLRPQYRVGDAVLYQICRTVERQTGHCDPPFTDWVAAQMTTPIPSVQALTSKQFVSSAVEKQRLANTYSADVVDMEGMAILSTLAPLKAKVAMLRVVSDGCEHDLPNLTKAIRVSGRLSPSHLILEMSRQPKASLQFVRGSLQGLRRLRQITTELFDASKTNLKRMD